MITCTSNIMQALIGNYRYDNHTPCCFHMYCSQGECFESRRMVLEDGTLGILTPFDIKEYGIVLSLDPLIRAAIEIHE